MLVTLKHAFPTAIVNTPPILLRSVHPHLPAFTPYGSAKRSICLSMRLRQSEAPETVSLNLPALGSHPLTSATKPPHPDPESTPKPKPKKSKRKRIGYQPGPRSQAELRHYFIKYFAEFPNFNYDPAKPFMSEYKRMCTQFGWVDEDANEKKAFKRLQRAMGLQFDHIFGDNEKSRAAWHHMFSVMGIDDRPDKVESCIEVRKC
jgi:hypothetical protein